MPTDSIVFTVFLIFTGAALVATLALYARQSLLVAYIFLGALLGPWGLELVSDAELVRETAEFGIIFLLFLLGLNLQPQELFHMVRKTTWVTVWSSFSFAAFGFAIAMAFGFSVAESLLVGGAATFSSTIIGLKLLPTTVLHHQRSGEVIISILLLQDLIAIFLLILVQSVGAGDVSLMAFLKPLVMLPALIGVVWLANRYVLLFLIARFDRIQEYVFLLAIGWCLGIAELAMLFGLSAEIGAFIAGITLASSPIALFIAESLKPLRDFFLVLFFFSLGAGFDLSQIDDVLLPAALLAVGLMLLKPWIFKKLLLGIGESEKRSHEVGYRLGQMSEFSLLVVVLAVEVGALSAKASYMVQLATLMTFLISSYLVVARFPTPIAVKDELRRD